MRIEHVALWTEELEALREFYERHLGGRAGLRYERPGVAELDRLTEELAAAGVPVADGPRQAGDGYYEAVVLDPDGNRIELAAE